MIHYFVSNNEEPTRINNDIVFVVTKNVKLHQKTVAITAYSLSLHFNSNANF